MNAGLYTSIPSVQTVGVRMVSRICSYNVYVDCYCLVYLLNLYVLCFEISIHVKLVVFTKSYREIMFTISIGNQFIVCGN